jgi:diguanylate cyclase (GGDEF)-like protein/PAS domain S-box-containing protein
MLANKIMIVEDEGIIAMDLRKQLEDFGYEVVATAFSGEQAITLASQHKPQLVMMDIVLKGGMDGISAAKKMSELHIPVIFLTAYSDAATLARAKATGAYGYLIKPFRPDELHASIEVALSTHQLVQKLNESERWFAMTLHCISDAVIATDAEGHIRFMNPVAETAVAWKLDLAKGKTVSELMTLLAGADRTIIENPVPKALTSRVVCCLDNPTVLVTQSGVEFHIDEGGASPIIDDFGTLLGAVFVFRDITERRRIENLLLESEVRFHSAFEHASIGMALVSVNNHFLLVNSSLCALFGYTEEELLRSSLQILTYNYDNDTVLVHHLSQLLGGELPSFQIEQECYHKVVGKVVWVLLNASLVRNAAHEPLYFIIQIQDITARKHAEQRLSYLANHDALTGLLNRTQFHDRFTLALASVLRRETKLALMFLDLDRFKLINDTLGHRIGDLLLQAVSVRLKSSVRVNDVLARLGGDEFIVLLNDINLIDDVARIAQKAIDALSQPFSLEGNDIVVTASIGISVYPDDGANSQILLTNADTAMYLAKERGKNNFQFYTQEMTERSRERMTIERGLRHALANNGLRLHFLPQVSLTNGMAASVEALVRWQHPEWGLVYPERFISVAEDTGLIVPLGNWVLRSACRQAKKWHDTDGPFTHVAVNVSARQFFENDLFQTVKAVLAETGLQPSSLELEITESAVMQDPERTLQVLKQLNGLGVRLSIDDFGTGYSSLTYLQRFPVHSVKIDRSFVQNIPQDEASMTLVRAIIALAHELKLCVTAEGVETEEQLAFLKDLHCDVVQGYLFSQPVPSDQLATVNNIMETIKTLLSRH